jgi:hypothetical protein
VTDKTNKGDQMGFAGWAFMAVITPIIIGIRGLCISAMWGWFIAPVTGWREISTPEAIGISLFMSLFSNISPPDKSKFEGKTTSEITAEVVGSMIGVGVLAPLLVLLMAWLFWKSFIMQTPS